MKIAIIGVTGFVGSHISTELINRKHSVTGISRKEMQSADSHLTYLALDVSNVSALAEGLKGHDIVVSAFNAGWTNPNLYADFLAGSAAIQKAVKKAGIPRFIIIGGAGSLYDAAGKQVVDSPSFPQEYFTGASAARDYYSSLQTEKDVDWVFFSPALEMHPGITTGRTGSYRLGKDHPVLDENQRSILSVEDLAVVIADEIEKPKHHQERFTAAY